MTRYELKALLTKVDLCRMRSASVANLVAALIDARLAQEADFVVSILPQNIVVVSVKHCPESDALAIIRAYPNHCESVKQEAIKNAISAKLLKLVKYMLVNYAYKRSEMADICAHAANVGDEWLIELIFSLVDFVPSGLLYQISNGSSNCSETVDEDIGHQQNLRLVCFNPDCAKRAQILYSAIKALQTKAPIDDLINLCQGLLKTDNGDCVLKHNRHVQQYVQSVLLKYL